MSQSGSSSDPKNSISKFKRKSIAKSQEPIDDADLSSMDQTQLIGMIKNLYSEVKLQSLIATANPPSAIDRIAKESKCSSESSLPEKFKSSEARIKNVLASIENQSKKLVSSESAPQTPQVTAPKEPVQAEKQIIHQVDKLEHYGATPHVKSITKDSSTFTETTSLEVDQLKAQIHSSVSQLEVLRSQMKMEQANAKENQELLTAEMEKYKRRCEILEELKDKMQVQLDELKKANKSSKENSSLLDKVQSLSDDKTALERRIKFLEDDNREHSLIRKHLEQIVIEKETELKLMAAKQQADAIYFADEVRSRDKVQLQLQDVKPEQIPNSQIKRKSSLKESSSPIKSPQKKTRFPNLIVFLDAALDGDLEELSLLLDQGIDVNMCNEEGITAMHCAACNGHLDVLEFLVKRNANVNAVDVDGWTPLHGAACLGDRKVVQFIVEHGGDVSALNEDGESAVNLVMDNQDLKEYLEQIQAMKQSKNVVTAMYDYESADKEELSFQKGCNFQVISRNEDDWWLVEDIQSGRRGLVPSNYVQ